jgi:hypothetical protein
LGWPQADTDTAASEAAERAGPKYVSTASSVRFPRATRLLQPTDEWVRLPLCQ